MSSDQADQMISLLSTVSTQLQELGLAVAMVTFVGHCVAFGVAWIAGQLAWRLIVVAKNQRGFW